MNMNHVLNILYYILHLFPHGKPRDTITLYKKIEPNSLR